MLARRDELITRAVIEAARHFMAAELVLDRAPGIGRGREDRVNERDGALQDLRDAIAAERKLRAEAGRG